MASQLSPEILIEIFALLPKSDLYTCLFVCRQWFYPAACSYYHTISIKDNRNRLAQFRDYLFNSNLPVGSFIKHIQIDSDPSVKHTVKTKQEFQDILSLCPNLNELTMSKNVLYWQYLYESTNSFQPFRLSSTGRKSYCNEGYFYKASHKFKKSITELEIHRSCDDSIYQTYHSLFGYLAEFPRLKHLSITSGSQKHTIYLDQLLRTCKRLASLSFQIDHPLSEFHPDKSPYPSMHALDIFLANFSVQSLQYIIHRFINLERFTLRINQNEREPNLDCFFKTQFVPFLQSLEYANLQFQINGRSTLEDTMHYLRKSHATAQVKFDVHDGRAERTQISYLRERKSLDLGVVFVRDIATDRTEELPYSAYLQSFGSTIRQLCITFTTHLKYHEAANLNSVLDVCPQLNQLSIHMDQPPLVYFNSAQSQYPTAQLAKTKHVSELQSLSLSCMTISHAFIQALAQYHPHLKQLSLVNCLPETCSYDLTGLQLDSFTFDIIALRRLNRESSICVAIELGSVKRYYLALPNQSPRETFSSISESDCGSLEQENLRVISFKVDQLKRLELQAGKNQAFTKVIEF